MKPGGVYILVTYGQPEQRQLYLNKHVWNVESLTVPKPPIHPDRPVDEKEVHYIYVCTKIAQ